MQRNKLKCPLCGREISKSNFTKHQKRHENNPGSFNKAVYKLTHDDLFCKFCGKECKNKNSLIGHELRCKENPNRNYKPIPGFNAKGRTSWNKGLTKETDDRVRKSRETFFINERLGLHKSHSHPHTEETKAPQCSWPV